MARILVLGGDGFCGWPTALHLSSVGHEVAIVDNLSRRQIDIDLDVSSLTPIASPNDRLQAWSEVAGRRIKFSQLDIALDFAGLLELLRQECPDVVVHFAEQRSAPYSMKGVAEKRYTVDNNTRGTHNLLVAMLEANLDAHLVHLGTMGVYGYHSTRAPIPEGYLTVNVPTLDGESEEREILYPTDPGSVYHMTKSMDQIMFAFYAKNNGFRITDLHQGIVWGGFTEETARDERLINRLDYDGDYGTVLNRFLIQAAVGHPLTVHGTGGQSRAFIHISDSVKCIELAVASPPRVGDRVRVLNQMTEVFRISDLAMLVSELCGADIAFCDNPRREAAENDLNVTNRSLLKLGLKPTRLREELLIEISRYISPFLDRVDLSRIPARSTWTPGHKPGLPLD